jgi:membrane protein required for colicin V production
VLIIISLISVKISDLVVDSAAGAFDRTLGFFFGVARGFLLVVIAYLFYGWFAAGNQEPWVRDAKSLPIIKTAGNSLCELMPADICETLRNSALQKQEDQPAPSSSATQDPAQAPGYQSNETQSLDNLVQGTGDPAAKTDNPQNTDQGNGQ